MNRRIRFALAGLVVYAISLLVLDDDRVWVVVLGSMVRLLLAMTPWWRIVRLWPLALAFVYPFDLTLKVYARRWDWAPEEWAIQLSTPTAYLIWMGAWLFLSILTAGWAVMKAAPGDIDQEVRTLSKWLFAVTAVGLVVSLPPVSMRIFHLAAEPLALIGYCWVMGKAPEDRNS